MIFLLIFTLSKFRIASWVMISSLRLTACFHKIPLTKATGCSTPRSCLRVLSTRGRAGAAPPVAGKVGLIQEGRGYN